MFITNCATDLHVIGTAFSKNGYTGAIYSRHTSNNLHKDNKNISRIPNLKTNIVKQISEKIGLIFTSEKETTEGTFAPIDILDYIYAVLHSPSYREKYKEFLKIDFPRAPYPDNKFQILAACQIWRRVAVPFISWKTR